MINTTIIVLAVGLLSILLYFEKRENHKGMVASKACLSTLFILAALIQSHPIPGYYRYILIGLIFCLGGDILLALPQEKMFKIGLVSFLLGHILYIVAFFQVAQINTSTGIGSLAVVVVSLIIFLWLRPHLGSMLIPVILYILVITVMLTGAITVWGDSRFSLTGRLLVLGGALMFYVSDVFVARHRFISKDYVNRLVGLPLYNAGQFFLAFSTGLLG